MDGSYDTNKNFKYLYEKKILPGIKIRKNSITSTKKNTRLVAYWSCTRLRGQIGHEDRKTGTIIQGQMGDIWSCRKGFF